ncbi:MAG: serine protease [Thermoguttaceae bacterium]
MKRLLAIWIVLGLANTALGWPSLFAPPQPPQTPHPAVVRVIAEDRDGFSKGSGALVAVDQRHGLVLTNWHVVRDAAGAITVIFPDGFRAGALVLKADRDWDLAALAIVRPYAEPIPLATQPPRPGELLWIAGYGSDSYRAVSGRCTEYLSPGGNLPNEMVELEAGARLGDSGGPILNERGELAGILFGTGGGRTMGSYCGRVRDFMVSTGGDFHRLQQDKALFVTQSTPPYFAPAVSATIAPPAAATGSVSPASPSSGAAVGSPPGPQASNFTHGPQRPEQSASVAASSTVESPASPQAALPSRLESIKTILAAIGVVFLLFHGIRLAASAAG